MKKILASIAALAMAATMATSAFAAKTFTGADEYCGNWKATNFVMEDDTLKEFIDNADLEEFLETGATFTVEFEYYTLAGKPLDYYLFGVCVATEGWPKLYATDSAYFADVPAESDGRIEGTSDAKTYEDGTPVCKYFFQSDGMIVLNKNAAGEWETKTIQFTITPEGLQHLVDTATENPDGSLYGGLCFQVHGVHVTSVTIEAAKDLPNNGYNADPNAGAEDEPTTDAPTTDEPTTDAPTTDAPTTDAPAGDDNANTGATAGLALAAIALAGAAVVATKKNK